MAYNVDPDQMPHSVASDPSPHCLQRPFCTNTKGYNGNTYICMGPGYLVFDACVL